MAVAVEDRREKKQLELAKGVGIQVVETGVENRPEILDPVESDDHPDTSPS